MLMHITIKKLDHKEGWVPKNWCFWTVVLEKTLENPLDRKEIQQISPEWPLEGLMLKLKLQYFGNLMRRGEGDDRGWDGWMASPTQWTWVWVNSGNWWWTGRLGILQSMGSQRVRHDWVTILNWTEGARRYMVTEKITMASKTESGQTSKDLKIKAKI